MKDEVKNSILNKNSFLIYGYDHGYNIDIFNELVEGLEARYSEIFYFDMISYSDKPKFKQEYHRASQELDLFESFKEKEIPKRHFERYVKDICDCLHAMFFDKKVDGQIYLTSLLQNVYRSEYANTFNFDVLIELLGDIINASESRRGNTFYKTLDELDRFKLKHPEDYYSHTDFDKLAKNVRLQLERYLLLDHRSRKYSEVALELSNYDSGIEYFTKLLEKMNITASHKFGNGSKTMPGKINYFQIDRYTTRCNYLDMFLSNLVRKLIIYNSTNKPLIIINGKQKDLFKSVSMGVEELFQKCDVCFFINSDEDLDSKINYFVDVKIYSHKHKNLSLHPSGVEKRIENDYTVHY